MFLGKYSKKEGIHYAENNITYEILSENNISSIYETAECVAETFTGVQVGNEFISEPITFALGVSKDILRDYLIQYLKIHAKEGLTVIARDKNTAQIIGAIISESYNPEEKPLSCEGRFESLRRLIEVCEFLDKKYVDFFKWITGEKLNKHEHIHAFMIGIKLEKNKKYVGMQMAKLLEEVGKEKGYKSIIGEITNFKSQKFWTMLNWTFPVNEKGYPIVYKYENDIFLKSIPKEKGSFCHLAYKSLL